MPILAANLSMMFQEVPFLERFGAAAAVGFRAVEYLFPYEHPADAIAAELRTHGLTQALFNLPPGDWAAGERGIGALPGRQDEFRAGVDTALSYALATGCVRLHVMSGLCPQQSAHALHSATYVTNLQYAADLVAPHGITLLVEPINSRDMPGYFINTTVQAFAIIDHVQRANVKLQLDLYHCAIMEGDLATKVRTLHGRYAHVQVAGVPDRHEPGIGEIHYPYLFNLLDATGYDGFVGCEYRPAGTTVAGLGWAAPWGIRTA